MREPIGDGWPLFPGSLTAKLFSLRGSDWFYVNAVFPPRKSRSAARVECPVIAFAGPQRIDTSVWLPYLFALLGSRSLEVRCC
jgi:hypothetical protein